MVFPLAPVGSFSQEKENTMTDQLTAQQIQDIHFINNIRNAATQIIDAANTALVARSEWLPTFAAGNRLGVDTFLDENLGLDKTKISNGLDIMSDFNTWLDAENTGRRAYLMAIAKN
jgi:hypothetical protein